MTQDDKDIRLLFDGFVPQMTPDDEFEERLFRNLKAVEAVRQYRCRMHRRGIWAVLAGAMCGIVAGAVTTLVLQSLDAWHVDLMIPWGDYHTALWLMTAAAACAVAIGAYNHVMHRDDSVAWLS